MTPRKFKFGATAANPDMFFLKNLIPEITNELGNPQ